MRRKNLKRKYQKLMLVIGGMSLMLCISFMVALGHEEQQVANTSSKVEKYLGEKVVSILTETTKTKAFRVDPKARQDWPKGTATSLDEDLTAKLKAIVLDENTYHWAGNNPMGRRCLFEPAVAYQFASEKESVAILICFKCKDVLFVSSNPQDKGNPFRRTVAARLHPEIVKLTKQVFPDDKDIQALKD